MGSGVWVGSNDPEVCPVKLGWIFARSNPDLFENQVKRDPLGLPLRATPDQIFMDRVPPFCF